MSFRKLPDEERSAIHEAHASGTRQSTLAATFNVSQSCISAVVNEEQHLPSIMRSARKRLKKLRAGREAARV